MDSTIFSARLKPAELEERFRMETLARDKAQVTVIGALTLILVVGFIALDLYLLHDGVAFYISTASRCIAAIASLGAIWMIRRQSSIRSFDRIMLVWMTVHTCHLLIVNALGIADYVPVVVWDVFTILAFYFVVPVSLRFQIPPALLLTGGSGVLWLIYRLGLASTYETVAVLVAYVFANVFGIFVSRRLNRSHRQQFVLTVRETEARKELETALAEVKTLRGIIPICASCKNIRDDEGYWHQVEAYIARHSEADFTHGICPVCAERLYPEWLDDERGMRDHRKP